MGTFRFDLLSFWIGFLAATVFWGIIKFLFPRIPVIRKRFAKMAADMRARNLAGIEAITRREILKRTQKMHLAGNLFALDEILIEPRLILPPQYLDNGKSQEFENLVDQTIPYTPDWPELATPYAVTAISLAQAMEKGANIALIGEPGTGKTVALAHFASLIARKDPASGQFADFTTCYINIVDINYKALEQQDPVDLLIKSTANQYPLLIQQQIPRFLRRKINENLVMVLIDGLDELPNSEIFEATNYLRALVEKYPLLRLVVAGSPHFLDGLLKIGLYPISLAGWSRDDLIKYLHTWDRLWSTYISPEVSKQTSLQEIPGFMMKNWLENEQIVVTPFEWTIKTWLSYTGELNGFGGAAWIESFIHRYIQNASERTALEQLANKFCMEGRPALPFSECDKFITNLHISIPEPAQMEDAENTDEGPSRKAGKTKEKKLSSGGRILEDLIQKGFLIEHSGELISFINPLIGGYLASFATEADPSEEILQKINWPMCQYCLHYLSARQNTAPWIDWLIRSDESPLLSNILLIGRWIRDAAPNSTWRSNYMRKLIGLVQSESIPIPLRARLLSVCVTANDPSMLLLLKQLILSKSFAIRKLAALAYGAIPSVKSFDELLELMVDPVPEVRNAACVALSAIRNPAANAALVDILINGDESLQQVAAESLAYRGEEGHRILRETLASQDLMVRRAVVLGLARIYENWSRETLEKIAVEDGQWVVRNAAVQALEELHKNKPHAPEPPEPATQAAWLLEFAGKQGVGLRPDEPAVEMLINALKSGTPEEKILAMRYLRLNNEEGIIGAIYQIAFLEQGKIAEAGLYAVWMIALSGTKLPPLAQYGVG